VIADGEVSSPVTGDELARNSAFVLAWRAEYCRRRVAVLSAGTDGIDGNSPAAGSVADGETLGRAMAAAWIRETRFGAAMRLLFRAAERRRHHRPDGEHLRDLRILLSEP